jgi:hypothetical protein
MDLLTQIQNYLQGSFGLVPPLWGLTGLALGIGMMLLLDMLQGRRLKSRERALEAGLATMAREKAAAEERVRQLGRREERLREAENALRTQADAFQAQVEQVRGWLDQLAPPSAVPGRGDSTGRLQSRDGA